jgi:hypothetical protein
MPTMPTVERFPTAVVVAGNHWDNSAHCRMMLEDCAPFKTLLSTGVVNGSWPQKVWALESFACSVGFRTKFVPRNSPLFNAAKKTSSVETQCSCGYEAALSNFERAKDCYRAAGLAAEWEQTVRRVCTLHNRKTGFINRFQALVAGAKRCEPSSFLERAKTRCREQHGRDVL